MIFLYANVICRMLRRFYRPKSAINVSTCMEIRKRN